MTIDIEHRGIHVVSESDVLALIDEVLHLRRIVARLIPNNHVDGTTNRHEEESE